MLRDAEPMPRAPDLTNVALDGRYELHAVIGEGAFGRVYRGRDRRLARWVAVKVIKPWWAEDPAWARSFEREAQLLASVNDPGIVQIFDVGSAPEGLYYVAELVDGESLADRLRRGPLAPAAAADIAEQLARALASAHAQRVVHRDVKPANVLISHDGRIKVGDFGIARLAEGTSDGGLATIVGTPLYMAPEQARDGATSPATDVYGVGVVLYEMLAGQPPFQGGSPVELALRHVNDSPPPLDAGVPAPLARIVARALAKDPAERYPEGGAMARALQRASASIASDDATELVQTAVLPAAATTVATRNGGAATRVVPRRRDHAAGVVAPPPRRRDAPTRVGDPRSPRRNVNPAERRQRFALLGLVAALGIGMVAVAFLLMPGHVKVPDLRGMRTAQISPEARRIGLRPAFSHRYSGAPPGTAIAQTPAAGSSVDDGSTVRVVLSGGPAPVKVPALIGSSATAAQSQLGRLNLNSAASHVPAPGTAAGTVVSQSPPAGSSLAAGSTVALSVAESPRWRSLTSFSGAAGGRSVPFRIRGNRWRIVSGMGYSGTCTFILICSGPSATVVNLIARSTVDQFDLGDGNGQIRSVGSGPGVYQITVSPGSDTAGWTIKVEDYY